MACLSIFIRHSSNFGSFFLHAVNPSVNKLFIYFNFIHLSSYKYANNYIWVDYQIICSFQNYLPMKGLAEVLSKDKLYKVNMIMNLLENILTEWFRRFLLEWIVQIQWYPIYKCIEVSDVFNSIILLFANSIKTILKCCLTVFHEMRT